MREKRGTGFTAYEQETLPATAENMGRILESLRKLSGLDHVLVDEAAQWRELLAKAGFDGNLVKRHAEIRERFGEQSVADLAAEFVITVDRMSAERERLEATGVRLGNLIVAAANGGVLRERIGWKYGIDSETDKTIEKLALQAQGSMKGLKKSKANNDRHFIAENWHDEARAVAAEIRKRAPHLSKSAVAHRVIRELRQQDPSFSKAHRTVRDVI